MCTLERRGGIFILTMVGDDEHWLNGAMIGSLLSALRQVKLEAGDGSALITTSQGRFFSNGLDLVWIKAAVSKNEFRARLLEMVNLFKQVIAELIALPLPTVAAVQGHAAAAGFVLALSHDYVLMRSDRGVLYMSEIDLGLPQPDYFSSLFRAKLRNSHALRDVLLKGDKLKGHKAVEMGIVDSAHNGEDSLAAAAFHLCEQLASRKWICAIYGETRMALYPELCLVLGITNLKTKSLPKL